MAHCGTSITQTKPVSTLLPILSNIRQPLARVIYRHPYLFWFTLLSLVLLAWKIELPDPMQRDERGRTALYIAAESGDIEKVSSLLDATDNPDQCDDCLWTPLMRAAQNGHADVVKILLDAGADVNAVDKAGYSVLMVTAIDNNPAILAILAEHGASLDQQDPDFGWSALIWAAKEGHVDNVRVLLDAGANPQLADQSGKTARDWAQQNAHQEVLALLPVR